MASSPKHQQMKKKKQRPLVLRRAMLHSCACFLVGLVTGLAPSDWAAAASRAAADANTSLLSRAARAMNHTEALLTTHYQLLHHPRPQQEEQRHHQDMTTTIIVITTTAGFSSSDRERRSAGLTRTAHALRLVPPPVLWLVVEAAREAPPTAALLRRTGVLYRHLTYADNFTSDADGACEEERHHQRNVALAHIERHRLRGVVLFAGLADVYDIRLLDNLRHIRTLGAWAVATVWQHQRRVAVEGCAAANATAGNATTATAAATTAASPVTGFAFASHLLWDPARWDRFPTSEPDQSQDSIKFVQRLLVEDYNETTPIIPACSSQVMAWRLVDTTLPL